MNKKMLALVLALMLVLTLTACGNKNENEPAQDTTVEAPENNQETETPEEPDVEVDVPAEMPEEPADKEETPEQPSVEVKPETPAEKPQTPAETPSASVDLEAFYNEIYEKLYPVDAEGNPTGPFVMDLGVDAAMVEGFYPDLAVLSTKQLHIYMPAMSGVPYELALVEAANAGDVEAIKAALQARIDTELQNHMNYPAVLENWKVNSRIVSNGNFVLMAVTSDCDAYVEAFNALF